MISERAAQWIKGCLKEQPNETHVTVFKLGSAVDQDDQSYMRNLIVLNANEETQNILEQLIEEDFAVLDSRVFDTVDAIQGQGSFRIWENWRGRVLQANQIVEGADTNQILRSWWRIMVTRRNLVSGQVEYFVRHDIYPFLFSPGFSAAGFDGWQDQVQSELRIIGNRAVDNWDSLKVFVGRAVEATNNPTNFAEVLNVPLTRNNFPGIQNQITAAIEANLAQN
ncbi:MAG: hypothetical protein IPK68_09955 [Bdellovibrionales bacterium]|nr:hypothetical protein [Bdellovibrionales bacterium]